MFSHSKLIKMILTYYERNQPILWKFYEYALTISRQYKEIQIICESFVLVKCNYVQDIDDFCIILGKFKTILFDAILNLRNLYQVLKRFDKI